MAVNHTLIEGDNLPALTALTFTHENKIDVIYIDPPYNTGKENEFKYNDKYVDGEDEYRHSKWLSFIYKRLKIAHKLLSESGVMIINIDDNEVAQLKMLCDDIFNKSSNPSSSNQLGLLIWDLSTGTSAGHFTRTHEYILVYAKNKKNIPNFSGGEGIIDDRAQKKIGVKNPASEFEFPAGKRFDAPNGFELVGSWGGVEESSLIKGRMICENGKLKEKVTLYAGWTQKNQMKSFFAGEKTIDSKGQTVIEFYFRENGKIYCKKDKSKLNPPSVLREIATTKQGTGLLKSIFNGEEPISFVKPIQLIQFFLELLPKDSIVLDFFAGSGTTLHATMALNADDDGSRQCILVTNNENNICEEVTYERNKRVIEGYTNAKGVWVSGLSGNNLRYYQTATVEREPSLRNKRQLTRLATELLCIKEDCYDELNSGLPQTKLFENHEVILFVLFDDIIIPEAIVYIQALETSKRIKVYVFSMGADPYTEDFAEVAHKIELCALPDAVYKAYQHVLPKKKRSTYIIDEEILTTSQPS